MQFSHSGAYLISADQAGTIKYFQPNMNNLAATPGHREAIRGLSFSPDDARFATASDDSTIKLWAFEEMREERTITGKGRISYLQIPFSVSIFPKLRAAHGITLMVLLAIGHLWDVKCVEWHPTKGLLASGSKDNLVKFWDPRTGQNLSTSYVVWVFLCQDTLTQDTWPTPLLNSHEHKNTVQAIAWNPNGDLLATASRDQTVRVFDIRAMREVQIFKGHKKEVCCT